MNRSRTQPDMFCLGLTYQKVIPVMVFFFFRGKGHGTINEHLSTSVNDFQVEWLKANLCSIDIAVAM